MDAPDPADTYDVRPDRALPTVAYRSQAAFEAEREMVWRRSWVFVGTADQVAEPGDHFPVVVGGQPILVLRDQAGELGALSNLCAHRGTLLVDEPGNAKRFQCPYHAWTYADDGTLLSVPHTDRDDIDRTAHCLPQYRAEVWRGLVFACLDPDVAPMAERLAHLEPALAGHAVDGLHHWTAHRGDEEWAANWKLIITNAMESYHLFKVHPETLEPYTPTAGAYYVTGSADGTITGGTMSGGDDYRLVSLPPNFVGVLQGDSLLWQAVEPLAVDRSRVITGGAYRHAPPGDGALGRLLNRAVDTMSAMPDFLPEDKAICERGQAGASGDVTPGRLVPHERVIGDFHHFLARQLHGRPAPRPASA